MHSYFFASRVDVITTADLMLQKIHGKVSSFDLLLATLDTNHDFILSHFCSQQNGIA